jgi:hypothetical protein
LRNSTDRLDRATKYLELDSTPVILFLIAKEQFISFPHRATAASYAEVVNPHVAPVLRPYEIIHVAQPCGRIGTRAPIDAHLNMLTMHPWRAKL